MGSLQALMKLGGQQAGDSWYNWIALGLCGSISLDVCIKND